MGSHNFSRHGGWNVCENQSVMSTANDAVIAKLSTSQQGYYDDPFLPYFVVAKEGHESASNRGPTKQRTKNFSIIPSHSLRMNMHCAREENFYPHVLVDASDQLSGMPVPCNPHSTNIGNRPKPYQRRPPPPPPPIQYNSNSQPRSGMHQPIIRRGTHARVLLIDYAVTTFLSLCSSYNSKHDNEVQIVILGSGKDTTYLRHQIGYLHDKSNRHNNCGPNQNGEELVTAKWFEVDYPSVIQSKLDLLRACDLFEFEIETIPEPQQEQDVSKYKSHRITPKSIQIQQSNIHDGTKTPIELEPYSLLSFDLRDPFESLLANLRNQHNFKKDQPTLFIMECVQMYLPEDSSRSLLQTISNECMRPFMALFDPIIQDDSFGRVMTQNLTKAGITDESMSMLHCTTLNDQVEKLAEEGGFEYVTGCDFWNASETILTTEDRKRATRVEMLDEVEELMLIMRHYCFVVAAGRSEKVRRVGYNNSCDVEKDNVDDKKIGEDKDGGENEIQMIAKAFCSVEDGNPFGFVKSKCETR